MKTSVDEALIHQIKGGDENAFEVMMIKYRPRILATLLKYTSSRELSEDLTQQTFLRVWEKIDTFKGNSALFTWIYSISINLARNYYASSQGKKTLLTDSNENLENEVIDFKNPENQLLNNELLLNVNSCLKSMPIDLRTAFSLRVEEKMSYDEISKIMNVPIGTVRSRIFRAREILAKQIEDIL
tara:strand:- start:384 stop:938 length:555 start_codon:yes stop_codon:yes gene_type:complete